MESLKIYLVSLGCSKNLVDSEHVIGNLGLKGFSLTVDIQSANVFLINTCGFIGPARDEGYKTIEEALDWKARNKGIVCVIGCLAQKETAKLNKLYPEIDVISGFGGYSKLDTSIRKALLGTRSYTTNANLYQVPEANNPIRLTGGASAYLKLGEGCSKRCAFCSIPHIRGNQHSVPLAKIVDRAKYLADEGVKELLLIAQDPITYGKDLPINKDIFSVIDALEKVKGIEWIRLHYLFPSQLVNAIVDRMAIGGKFLPYIDMPMQHVNAGILKRMNRPILNNTKKILDRAREKIKDLTLRTTFIVGFPGETEKTFKELEDFIRAIQFDKVGIFTFSPEEGTPAFTLDGQVDPSKMNIWKDHLMQSVQEISFKLNKKKINKKLDMIIDIPPYEDKEGVARIKGQSLEVDGLTYISILDKTASINSGDIIKAQIVDANEYDLFAEK